METTTVTVPTESNVDDDVELGLPLSPASTDHQLISSNRNLVVPHPIPTAVCILKGDDSMETITVTIPTESNDVDEDVELGRLPLPPASPDQTDLLTSSNSSNLVVPHHSANTPAAERLNYTAFVKSWIFPVFNLSMEMVAEIFNAISSKHKPGMALVAFLTSLATLLTCIIELLIRIRHEGAAWKKQGNVYWFFHQDGSPFGTKFDVVMLVCSTVQVFSLAIQVASYYDHHNSPVNISPWLIALVFGLLWEKFSKRDAVRDLI